MTSVLLGALLSIVTRVHAQDARGTAVFSISIGVPNPGGRADLGTVTFVRELRAMPQMVVLTQMGESAQLRIAGHLSNHGIFC
jgi:hypothetical protein